MNKIIINADDCGKTPEVNNSIRDCIENGLITSTTIMANMHDFEGALLLYKDYSDKISFGLHITLDEGAPLLASDVLLEKGYYKIDDGKVCMQVPNLKKPIPTMVLMELYKEIETQLIKLLDNGIEVTHIDSHHHVHSSPFILPIVMKLSNKYSIYKVRGIRNYYPRSVNKYLRSGWKLYAKLLNTKCVMTDYFSSISEYLDSDLIVDNSTIELMCHPGHPKRIFQEEIESLKDFVKRANNEIQFMSYSDYGK